MTSAFRLYTWLTERVSRARALLCAAVVFMLAFLTGWWGRAIWDKGMAEEEKRRAARGRNTASVRSDKT